MSRKWILLVATVLIFSASMPAYAEEQQAPQAELAKTEIAVDEATGTVSIIVDGKEVVRIDAQGMHVDGDIRFSGMMVDTDGQIPTKE